MEMKQIAQAFIKAKKQFSPALKTHTNPAFKSKYADLAACIEAVDDAFLNNGIVMYQETSEDERGVTVETVLLHESGEIIRCGKLHVPASKQDPQGFGSALSYARRYSLMAACGIAPEDDDGNAASGHKPAQQTVANPKPTEPTLMTAEQVQIIEAAAKAAGKDIARLCKKAGVERIADMPADWFDAVLNGINQNSTDERQRK